jgi:hypothetical protein
MSLTLDIVDILDELNMLLLVLEQQSNVLLSVKDQFQNMKPGADLTNAEQPNRIEIHVAKSRVGDVLVEQPRNARSDAKIFLDSANAGDIRFITSDAKGTIVAKIIRGYAGRSMREADELLRSETANLTRLRSDAKQVHRMVRIPLP